MLKEISELIIKMNEEMPKMVKSHTEMIGELDLKVAKIQSNIRIKTHAYIKNLKSFNREQKMKIFLEIRKLYDEALELSDKKIKMASEMYDKVDDNIKLMDDADRKFRDRRAQTSKMAEESFSNIPSPSKKNSSTSGRKEKRKSSATTSAIDHKAARLAESDAFMKELDIMSPSLVNEMEMPIDPNEPTYCKCHSVSFGRMIACDNKDCPAEWFHFACVGLTSVPKGRWYCEMCKPTSSKNPR